MIRLAIFAEQDKTLRKAINGKVRAKAYANANANIESIGGARNISNQDPDKPSIVGTHFEKNKIDLAPSTNSTENDTQTQEVKGMPDSDHAFVSVNDHMTIHRAKIRNVHL